MVTFIRFAVKAPSEKIQLPNFSAFDLRIMHKETYPASTVALAMLAITP